MMVTLVSQCEKKALARSRKVLDAFADRIGSNTWQTVITRDGLLALKKSLRKTASKNTAVSCHWLRSRSRSELIWVVGNRAKFNFQGLVPVNTTQLNLSHKEWDNGWKLNEVIAIAASLAGLFHDFGKANDLFQNKLKGLDKSKGEPFRHEWVSLRLFESFAKNRQDKDWLERLSSITVGNNAVIIEEGVLSQIFCDDGHHHQNAFKLLSPLAKLIGWLIVSHHRLPLSHADNVNLIQSNQWLEKSLNCHWNSKNAINYEALAPERLKQNWQFSHGTPFLSQTWQVKAVKLAQRALSYPSLFVGNWLDQPFVSHMSRLSLMLADHYYSSLTPKESNTKWCDREYLAYANTNRASKSSVSNAMKQKLDEHNIGVAQNALQFVKNLPALKYALPTIAQHKLFTKIVNIDKYRWQNKAFYKAKEFSKATEKQGFFGINMALTGCGKTLANARIMYGLADEKEGCRFSVALGLRTLTLQTGDAYRDLLKLDDDLLAVLIGSQAVKTLHELDKTELNNVRANAGSESSNDEYEQLYIHYEGQIYDGRLRRWLSTNPKLEKMISAPILVSTIDHLMPATESQRGGKQIAPMLRLLTSDLILDEPDDFNLEDLPALCRLVNWAGMLGSRVLLSSATLPPALIVALYDAYTAGRKDFNTANHMESVKQEIVCAWFDENSSSAAEIKQRVDFIQEHTKFVDKRIKHIAEFDKSLRKGCLVKVKATDLSTLMQHLFKPQSPVIDAVSTVIHHHIHTLHNNHHQQNSSGKKVSVGVVRMANINPMIAVSKALIALKPQEDFSLHYCVYHSQFPLASRSFKESRLDQTLSRYDEKQLFQQVEIKAALERSTTTNNIFIVIGTSVVEVGRDHDYDWAIAEPSSLRSLIQLAGRIQRHRQQRPSTPNLFVLNQNIRALNNQKIAYCHPGFETTSLPLASHDLHQLIDLELETITAIPRILEPSFELSDLAVDDSADNRPSAKKINSLAKQEHRALRTTLNFKKNNEKLYRNFKEAALSDFS